MLPTTHQFLVAMTSLVALCAGAFGAQPGSLASEGLRCEYLVNPLGVEEASPRLTWIVTSVRRAEVQSAYQVLVSSTPELLAQDKGDLWNSGRVESNQTAHIEYDGAALPSRQACYWKVRAWDRDGREGAWSKPAVWEMGLLAPTDWTAEWIDAAPAPVRLHIVNATYSTDDGEVEKDVTDVVARLMNDRGGDLAVTNERLGGDPAYGKRKRLRVEYVYEGVERDAEAMEGGSLVLPTGRLPYLRRGFGVSKPVTRARLYATALGVYEMSLNGARIGDQHLAPGWTDYRKRVRYQVYDVTDQLAPGENVLGAMVGPGWFCGRAGLFGITKFYGDAPALIAQLEITYADGSTDRIVTDSAWKTHAGPLLMADLMNGETYDATLTIPDWDRPVLDESGWSAATVRKEVRNLEADISEPVKVIAELPAVAVNHQEQGKAVFDLGQNMVGVVRLRINAIRGTTVTIRHGEMLNPDGTLYTANLRGAACTDTYTCDGKGEEVWQPRFTFHGFRYVEVRGLENAPDLETVTGIVLGSAMPPAGEFSCSDPRINQLQSNIVWGMRGNYLSIPTDCPQRDERMGWMADAQVFLPTAAMNADVAGFMTKWMTDVTDAQREDGAHSDVAPVTRGLTYGTPAWADAGSIVPWAVYETYGDKRLLERHVESMRRWVEWCRDHSTGLLRDKDRGNDYGDWLSIKADTPKDVLGTAYFAHSTDLLARSLRVLGQADEAAKYEQLLEDIKAAFNAAYVTPEGRIKGDTQTVYILGLRFNLLSAVNRERAVRFLIDDIRAKDGHLSTGFVGVSHLLAVLSESGNAAIAHELLMQDSFPSWLFSVKHGATTIWERWDGYTPETGPHPDIGMNSFNHYALGSCGRWLFEGVAGIGQMRGSVGFERMDIRPRAVGPLTSASASYRSIRGTVSTAWKTADKQLTLEVTIPANTTAWVHIPADSHGSVKESGNLLSGAEGVQEVLQDGGTTAIHVGSGTYRFVAPRDPL